jgi:hypothetical protein|tara:strand:- start:713 stop:1168 length:456 start_codon:yes stop_codon:yes gene_type:complete
MKINHVSIIPTSYTWDMTIRLSNANKDDITNLEGMMDKHYLKGPLNLFNSKKERRKNGHVRELDYGSRLDYRKGGIETIRLEEGYSSPIGGLHNVELNLRGHKIGFLLDLLELNPKMDLDFKRDFKQLFLCYKHFRKNEYDRLYEKIILGN